MKTLGLVLLCLAVLAVAPAITKADPLVGTTPIGWCSTSLCTGDQGTLTGYFVLDSTGTITNWDLTTTSGSVTGSHYTPSDANLPAFVAGGGTVYEFSDQFASGHFLGGDPNSPLFNGGTLTITVDCGGVANCLAQATPGQFFTITGATETFGTWFCSQGDLSCTISVDAPRRLDVSGGAFIDVTDPAWNLNTTAIGTPGSGSGTGNTGVPEPSSLLLSALGLGGLAALKRTRIRYA
jgi:hypothetical protein